VVLVADECLVKKESDLTSIWYPKGNYPEVRVSQEKEQQSFYGVTDLRSGKCHLRLFDRQTSHNTVSVLQSLEDIYKEKKVLLLWDGAPWHRGEVKQYLKQKSKHWQLRIEYFPPYWPKLNPQERIWKEVKQHTTHNHEGSFEQKCVQFISYICSHRFKTNFLTKYEQA
jgi:transposase